MTCLGSEACSDIPLSIVSEAVLSFDVLLAYVYNLLQYSFISHSVCVFIFHFISILLSALVLCLRFLYSTAPRSALGPIQPPIRRVRGGELFSWGLIFNKE
jgi:hypothetical protein